MSHLVPEPTYQLIASHGRSASPNAHICTGTGLAPPTSAPELGRALVRPAICAGAGGYLRQEGYSSAPLAAVLAVGVRRLDIQLFYAALLDDTDRVVQFHMHRREYRTALEKLSEKARKGR